MSDVPHIKVSIEYKGEEVSQYCAHFIDAISFLCQAEACIRRLNRLKDPVDNKTTEIQHENMKQLDMTIGLYAWGVQTEEGKKFYKSLPELISDWSTVLDPATVPALHDELMHLPAGGIKRMSVGGYHLIIFRF